MKAAAAARANRPTTVRDGSIITKVMVSKVYAGVRMVGAPALQGNRLTVTFALPNDVAAEKLRRAFAQKTTSFHARFKQDAVLVISDNVVFDVARPDWADIDPVTTAAKEFLNDLMMTVRHAGDFL